MASQVYFNAVADTGELDRTSITDNVTTATRQYSGQGTSGGLSEFAAWEVDVGGDLPAGVTAELWRLVDNNDSDSWQLIATLTATTSRVQMVVPNGTYRVVTAGLSSHEIKVLLQGI